jgi:prepilin peptidase CpaA
MAETVLQHFAFWLFPLVMAYAAWSDLFSMTISNRVSLVLAAGFLALAPFAGIPLDSLPWHLGVAGLVLALGFFCFAMGWIGGGDAKLAAVAALWLGWEQMLPFLVMATLFGGALTLFIMNFRQAPLPASFARQDWVAKLHDANSGVPYGIALAAAALSVYPDTVWIGLVTS